MSWQTFRFLEHICSVRCASSLSKIQADISIIFFLWINFVTIIGWLVQHKCDVKRNKWFFLIPSFAFFVQIGLNGESVKNIGGADLGGAQLIPRAKTLKYGLSSQQQRWVQFETMQAPHKQVINWQKTIQAPHMQVISWQKTISNQIGASVNRQECTECLDSGGITSLRKSVLLSQTDKPEENWSKSSTCLCKRSVWFKKLCHSKVLLDYNWEDTHDCT